MKLTLRTPWTSQPQVPVGVNRGNPLLLNVKGVWTTAHALKDATGNYSFTHNAAVTKDVRRSGPSRKYTNNGYTSQDTTVSGPTFSTSSTGWGIGLVGTAHTSLVAKGLLEGANNSHLVRTNATGNIEVFFSSGVRLTSSNAIVVGQEFNLIVWGSGATSYNILLNGVLSTTSASFSGDLSGLGRICGASGDGTNNISITAGVFWSAFPSAVQISQWQINPWQLFAPIQRTIWVPSAEGGPTYTLTAASGSFALTGQDAGLAFNRVLAADTQSYTLTGQATGLAFNRTLAAASGSFTLTGQDAGLAFNRVLSAASGSFALDGQDVTLTYTPISGATYTLGAASGSFALTGQDTGLAFNRVLTADTQSYSLSGDVAGLAFNRVLTADTVSYALTGQDASLSYTGFTYKLMADSASFALTGQDASFEFSGTTGVGGGGREKQRKKVLKDIKRLNELILKRDDEPDAEVTTVATPKPKAPKPAKFDTALITAKAKQQVIDDEEDELMLLMY